MSFANYFLYRFRKNFYVKHTTFLTFSGFNASKEDVDLIEESAAEAYEMHSSLLNKGFALERPPNVQQSLDGVIPFSFNSNERLFLRNFVNCTPGTSGGRLARWLQPESFIDVDQCEVHINSDDLKCKFRFSLTP